MNFKRYKTNVIDKELDIANKYLVEGMDKHAIVVLKALIESMSDMLSTFDTGDELDEIRNNVEVACEILNNIYE